MPRRFRPSFPYTTLFRSRLERRAARGVRRRGDRRGGAVRAQLQIDHPAPPGADACGHRARHRADGRQHLPGRAGPAPAVLPAAGAIVGALPHSRARAVSVRRRDASGRGHHGRVGPARRPGDAGRRGMTPHAIVIGAGANGLVAAHTLARAGRRVLVLEQRQEIDGALDAGWVPPEVVSDLGLDRHGLRVVRLDPWISVALPGGRRLEVSQDAGGSAEALRRASPADAAKWPAFCRRMHRLAGFLEALYAVLAPDVETRDLRELARLAGLGLKARRLGKEAIVDLLRVLPMSVAERSEERRVGKGWRTRGW